MFSTFTGRSYAAIVQTVRFLAATDIRYQQPPREHMSKHTQLRPARYLASFFQERNSSIRPGTDGSGALKVSAVVEGKLQEAVGAVQFQLVANVLAMIVDGADAQLEQAGDFLAGVILADEFEDPALGRRERLDLRFAQQQFPNALAA